MNKALSALALCLGLLAATAWAQQQDDPAARGAPGAQAAQILEETHDDQAARQRVQPLNNSPVWRAVNSGESHFTNLPNNDGGILIDPEGEPWRQLRNGPMTQGGGWGLVGVLILMALYYLYRGRIGFGGTPTGRVIERFTFLERAVHWTNAACFVWLALTGIVMLFGKHVVLPIFGATLFSWLAIFSKTSHNFIGPLFAATTIALFLIFVKDNMPRAYDLEWLKKGGGLLSRESHEPPSGRFNAGEKLLFWGGVVLIGIIVTVTGFVLDFPNFGQSRSLLQDAWWLHVGGALFFIALILGHIYIGTVGMVGAIQPMKTGFVDETWAKAHHKLWYDDIKAGKIPAIRSTPPPEGEPPVPTSQRV